MVAPAEKRLGLNGAEEIKKHPFFKNFDWKAVKNLKPPFIPEIKNDWDTKYFDKFEETDPFYPRENRVSKHRKVSLNVFLHNFFL
jgi:hypothetical protein